MGIVPWVSRNSGYETLLDKSIESAEYTNEHALDTSVQAVDSSNQTRGLSRTAATDLPTDLHELGLWLPEQFLANFGYKGAVHTTLGHPDAPVLVVVQHQGQNDGELPLTGDAAQLFELMVRSVGLGRSDVRQCALVGNKISSDSQPTGVQTVHEACTPQTRAILILLAMEDSDDPTADAHHCRFAQSQLPAWRIAHPEILLQENQRKRQAWQALKALQHYLAA